MNLHEKAYNIKKEVIRHWKGPERFVDVFLASILSRSAVLLLSSHGKGKTFLAEVAAKAINTRIGRVQGSVGLTQSKFLGRYDLAKLMKGEEEIIWNRFTDTEIKFFDEINRVPSPILSDLFSIMAEKKAYFGAETKHLGEFAFVATMNPSDDATFQIPPPLMDRFDVCLAVPTSKMSEKMGVIDTQGVDVTPVLEAGELQDIWRGVDKVEVREDVKCLASAVVRHLQLCKEGEKEALVNFPACCEECEYKNASIPCSKINGQVSDRVILSILRVAKGLAFLNGCNAVIEKDIAAVAESVLYHRVDFLPVYANEFKTREQAINNLVKNLFNEARTVVSFMGMVKNVRDGSRQFAELKRYADTQNLLIKELYDGLSVELELKIKEEKEKLLKEVEKMTVRELLETKKKYKDPDISSLIKSTLKDRSKVTFLCSDPNITEPLKQAGVYQEDIDAMLVDTGGSINRRGEYKMNWKNGRADITFSDPVAAETVNSRLLPFSVL